MAMNQSCYALIGAANGSGSAYTYFSTKNLALMLRQWSHGTAFEAITRATLNAVTVPQPTEEVLGCFDRIAAPILQGVRNNVAECLTLGQIRDALVPKLLSGEIRVKDAYAAIETIG